MKNSASDWSEYIESSDTEDAADEEEQSKVQAEEDEDDVSEGGSDSSSVDSPRRTRPNSYNTTWPQSYRQSIDIYSCVTPPTIGFIGTSNLSRLGSSFLTSSFGRHTPEVISSFLKPLLPTRAEEEQHQRKSSHTLIPPIPTRRSSHKKFKDEHGLSKASSYELSAALRKSSYTQGVFNGKHIWFYEHWGCPEITRGRIHCSGKRIWFYEHWGCPEITRGRIHCSASLGLR